MTTMDSDSESQDSDDGRRFRFEATRKDACVRVSSNTRDNTRSCEQKSEYSSRFNDDAYRDRKDRSRHESGGRREHRTSKDRDSDNKDSRYSTKHAHEWRSLRHEDSKDSRDAKNSGSTVSKHKTRESRRHRDRDRSEHRKHRSQERSRDRSQNGRSSADKHKSKPHEKYKRRSRDRSRERSYHSEKLKSSDHGKSRGEHERRESHKRASAKESESQREKEHSLPKNVEQGQCEDEASSTTPSRVGKIDETLDSQVCKDVNLSEFDVLSETDENLSDSSEAQSRGSVPRHRKIKVKKRNSKAEHENSAKKEATKSEPDLEERCKVNVRKNDSMSGSSHNNPSAVSDSLLGSASSVISAMAEDRISDGRERLKSKSNEGVTNVGSRDGSPPGVEASSQLDENDAAKEQLKSRDVTTSPCESSDEANSETYGPALPPQLSAKAHVDDRPPESAAFIGPCLPSTFSQQETDPSEEDTTANSSHARELKSGESSAREDDDEETDTAFGPALPPHLRKQKCKDEERSEIIGPALPSTVRSSAEVDEDDDDDEAIGPLPADHPALRNNYVHEQLEQRARRIRDEQREEEDHGASRREEWMTELPPAQASNLGLGPRKFRMRAAPDMSDRSCWSDTPAQRAEKQKQREQEKEINRKPLDADSVKQTAVVETGKSRKREKSLLEMHQKKLQKKKKKEEKEAKVTGQPTRRPFDRDIDLKLNQFDQAQKKSIFMKAQLLDERFSRGQI